MPEKPRNSRVQPRREVEAARKERVSPPPSDAIPVDKKVHTRWVWNNPKRMADMRRKYGYEKATEADVVAGHGGYIGRDGDIEKGDQVLMKTAVDVVEDKELKRREATANMDASQDRLDRAMGIAQKPNHAVKRGRGRSYNIPIDLSS